MAIGVVTDLGSKEAVSLSSTRNSRHKTKTLATEAQEPAKQPATTGNRWRRSCRICRYIERARAAVAGASIKPMI